MEQPIFNRKAWRRHLKRWKGAPAPRFLLEAAAEDMRLNLAGLKREFKRVLILNDWGGVVRAQVKHDFAVSLEPVEDFISSPLSAVGEEEALPFAKHSFDLIIDCFGLNFTNDVPGALIQIKNILTPDGLFLGALLGAESFIELRQALLQAESEVSGGVSPRLLPLLRYDMAPGLLQRAGFALPVCHREEITALYPDFQALVKEWRGIATSTMLHQHRRHFTARRVFERTAEIYPKIDGELPVNLEVIYLNGWAPAATQQQALRPGAAKIRLADVLHTQEISTGDKAQPK
ncbi:MAG: class I SAM-dependent methyltransferase [Dongiaceae bacterium]